MINHTDYNFRTWESKYNEKCQIMQNITSCSRESKLRTRDTLGKSALYRSLGEKASSVDLAHPVYINHLLQQSMNSVLI
jgi:hypothetical protein